MSQVRVTQYSSVEAGTSEDDILEVNQPQVGTLNVGPAKVGVLPLLFPLIPPLCEIPPGLDLTPIGRRSISSLFLRLVVR